MVRTSSAMIVLTILFCIVGSAWGALQIAGVLRGPAYQAAVYWQVMWFIFTLIATFFLLLISLVVLVSPWMPEEYEEG